MNIKQYFNQVIKRRNFLAQLISLLVGLYGFFIVFTTLFDQFEIYRLRLVNSFVIDIHLMFGVGFIYLSILLARKKRNALIVAFLAFTFLLIEGLVTLLSYSHLTKFSLIVLVRYVLLPLLAMIALLVTRDLFKVKSDQAAFRSSIKLSIIALTITLVYGVSGYMLMDKSDFHYEIGFFSAIHHTIDQFDLTTSAPLQPYTRRARIFMDSLSFVSVISLVYIALSFFVPVRARLIDQASNRTKIKRLMDEYKAPSEDYFKLWPHDKYYYFSTNQDAALAYQVKRGVALVLADPIGNKAAYGQLLKEFQNMCWANDWQPALIHINGAYSDFYKDYGFQLQLIGQEATVDIDQFVSVTASNKYFRNIRNRFNRENYLVEILSPPHHQAVLDRLQVISNDWLAKPGRTERGFVMGYYTDEYIQACRVVVVRDAAKTIQAFMNLVPSDSFNHEEITYDMLRGVKDAPSNINDFLIYQLLHQIKDQGYRYFNMGLCPLVGLDDTNDENKLIGSVLRFAYVNGDRIYSFSGLHHFKDKYEPRWDDRYLAYKSGIRGFSKMLNALVKAMKVRKSR